MAPPPVTAGISPPTAKVKDSGRAGIIMQYDPEDSELTYKMQFLDGQSPEADWFGREAVEMVSGDISSLGGGGDGAAPAALSSVSSTWATSRPVGTPVEDEAFICMGTKAPICPPPAANLSAWSSSRPVGTPVQDEGFICMGGKAPTCPTGPAAAAGGGEPLNKLEDGSKAPLCPAALAATSGPITLEVLQGRWTASGGAAVEIRGTDVSMNGLPLKAHKVMLNDDGTVRSIGMIWQLDCWAPEGGGLEFRCSSSRENMECAKLEVWTRASAAGGSEDWSERMQLMGYGGSSVNPLGRGVEGCMPGTMGIEMPEGYAKSRDKEEVALLTALISQWREAKTTRICPRQVIPDFTNRSQTGLGVELLHFVALSMSEKGFQKRSGKTGHDIPVVVREPPNTPAAQEALATWGERVREEEGFPPIRAQSDEELFTSLGNGHFFQALNLFATNSHNINDSTRQYVVGKDMGLADAIEHGVISLVLRHECPRTVRAKIAALLNSKREFQWSLNSDGSVDVSTLEENQDHCSHFEWLSKGMDAFQVDCLVRTHLGIRESKRIMG